MPRNDLREMSLLWFEPTLVELHQTGTIEGRSTDWATAHGQTFLLSIFLQGTIIDRIDYNIEHAHIRVEEGLKQLKQAEQYQKMDKKMHVIVVLAVILILLLIILIATKTWPGFV